MSRSKRLVQWKKPWYETKKFEEACEMPPIFPPWMNDPSLLPKKPPRAIQPSET